MLVEDEEGYIWVGVNTGSGLIRFHPPRWTAWRPTAAPRRVTALYDSTDGLQQTPLTWQSGVGAVRARDGRLWLTSGPGIAVIDPRHLPRSRRPAAPRVETVTWTAGRWRRATGSNCRRARPRSGSSTAR